MSVNFNVNGIQQSYAFEYTSPNTKNLYQNLLSQLEEVGNTTGVSTLTDLNHFNDIMVQLKAMLAGKGVNPNGTFYSLDSRITGQMAYGINTLLQLTKSININVQIENLTILTPFNVGVTDVTQLNQWRDFYKLGFNEIISSIKIGASASNTTLQALVQLEYVQGGNEMIYNQLSGLNEAMTATQKALTLLKNLQLVKNRATTVQNIYTAVSAWEATGTPPIANPLALNSTYPQNSLFSLILAYSKVNKNSAKFLPGLYKYTTEGVVGTQLKITSDATFATDLISQGPALITQLQQTIASLSVLIPSGTSPPSLVDQLTKILNDIQTGAPGVANQTVQQKFAWWLLDNYNSGTASVTVPGIGSLSQFNNINAGNFQRNLIDATTSAQSLNSAQSTQLQQTVFMFQEFYKSASAILEAINNILRQMAQGEAG